MAVGPVRRPKPSLPPLSPHPPPLCPVETSPWPDIQPSLRRRPSKPSLGSPRPHPLPAAARDSWGGGGSRRQTGWLPEGEGGAELGCRRERGSWAGLLGRGRELNRDRSRSPSLRPSWDSGRVFAHDSRASYHTASQHIFPTTYPPGLRQYCLSEARQQKMKGTSSYKQWRSQSSDDGGKISHGRAPVRMAHSLEEN